METKGPLQRVPSAWNWYTALCLLLTMINAAILALGTWAMTGGVEMAIQADRLQSDIDILKSGGQLLVWMGATFGLLNLVMLTLPRRPWAYFLHLGNILAAMPFVCPLPLAVPVFIQWIKPETREYFGFK